MAIVKCGANTSQDNIINRTVGEVRTSHSVPLGIDSSAVCFVNGHTVNEDYLVKEGDRVEFMKPAGQKGLAA